MGRKSNRGKEKKMKKREDEAKEAATWAIIDAANNLTDPMETLQPFKSYCRNGIDVTISCKQVTGLDSETIDWAFQLTKNNMHALYTASEWGWDDEQKKKEMMEAKAWYLIVREKQSLCKPVALVHFRFDMEDEQRVLYCYEIQLCEEVRRKGLGKFLMQILELLAFKTSMQKVMVTVFRHNAEAQQFFIHKLKYSEDDTSPCLSVEDAVYDDMEGISYQILSKTIKCAVSSSTVTKRPAQSAN
jgi:GNAT superfamily N-acetyltransferase